MAPIYGQDEDDFRPARALGDLLAVTPATQPSQPIKEKQMSISNEQIVESLRSLSDRVDANQNFNLQAIANMTQAMKEMTQNMGLMLAGLEARAPAYDNLLMMQQQTMAQLQQMCGTLMQMQQMLSVARPGIYNHPTQGIQYPNGQGPVVQPYGAFPFNNPSMVRNAGWHPSNQNPQQHFSGQHSVVGQQDRYPNRRAQLDQMAEFNLAKSYNIGRSAEHHAAENLKQGHVWAASESKAKLYHENNLHRHEVTGFDSIYPAMRDMLPFNVVMDPIMAYSGQDETHESVSVIAAGSKELRECFVKDGIVSSDFSRLAVSMAHDTAAFSQDLIDRNPGMHFFGLYKDADGTSALVMVPIIAPAFFGIDAESRNNLIEKKYLAVLVNNGTRSIYASIESVLAHYMSKWNSWTTQNPCFHLASSEKIFGLDTISCGDQHLQFPLIEGGIVKNVTTRLVTILMTPSKTQLNQTPRY